MARIITVLHLFATVFLGFLLAYLGVPIAYAWLSAVAIVGLAAIVAGRRIQERADPEAPPSVLTAIGYGFLLVFAPLLFAGGTEAMIFPVALAVGLAGGIAIVVAYRYTYRFLSNRGKTAEPQGPSAA
ncbi:hypothetical protein [Glycomyces albidus]|uniref:Uncharacterized protein n=1 Tax=Glycomyces albidus TaxID=2656774 RepID=A0A6L5GEU7_9ACTN|nr:hypothetical protein [Glycomyces albidus]MQM28229.1 hypothetical protein [Glycomyces albidus]